MENGQEKTLDHITGQIINSAIRLHKGLGPGLLESVYELVLALDLERRGFRAARQQPVSFEYDGLEFRDCLRVDLMVETRVVVEIKSVERALPVHRMQLLTYLRLLNLPVGLLINFGAPTLKQGLHRIVNGLEPSASPRESIVGANKGLGRYSAAARARSSRIVVRPSVDG